MLATWRLLRQTRPQGCDPREGPPQDGVKMRWLHLSDIHFGDNRFHLGLDRTQILSCLAEDAQKLVAETGPLDAILITGDLGWAGKNSDYEAAQTWLDGLQQKVTVGDKKPEIYAVPGNHDLDRDGVTKNPDAQKSHDQARADRRQFERLWQSAPGHFTQKFAEYEKVWGPPSNPPYWEKTLATKLGQIRLLGLNSALLAYDDQDKSRLALGYHQLLALQNPALTLVLQHHPPSWLADGEDQLNGLAQRPHLLLSGHEHQPQGILTQRTGQGEIFHISAPASHARDTPYFGYLLGELSQSGLRLWARTWARGRFVNDTHNFGNQLPVLQPLSQAVARALAPPAPPVDYGAYVVRQIQQILERNPETRQILAEIWLKDQGATTAAVIQYIVNTAMLSQVLHSLNLAHAAAVQRNRQVGQAIMEIMGWLVPIRYCEQEAVQLSDQPMITCDAPCLVVVETLVARLEQRGMAPVLDPRNEVYGRSALVQVFGNSFSRPEDLLDKINDYFGRWQTNHRRRGKAQDTFQRAYEKHQAALKLQAHDPDAVPPFYLVLYGPPQPAVTDPVQKVYSHLRIVYIPDPPKELEGAAYEIEEAFREVLERTPK